MQINYVQAVHDAIFVAAPRGAGKTIFLRNAKEIWDEKQKSDNTEAQKQKLYFCQEIDPTLLVNQDNFANVVIAHLYNEVENLLKNRCEQSSKDKFYQSLSKLADALGHSEYSDHDLTGIDRIVNYRSGIQLERHFHRFVEECLGILGVDAIVLPIDDVDMALGKAFEVLDVVRRLLGCPYMIPLVSGDKDLYQPIINNHFIYGGESKDWPKPETAREMGQLCKLFPPSKLTMIKELASNENGEKRNFWYKYHTKHRHPRAL